MHLRKRQATTSSSRKPAAAIPLLLPCPTHHPVPWRSYWGINPLKISVCFEPSGLSTLSRIPGEVRTCSKTTKNTGGRGGLGGESCSFFRAVKGSTRIIVKKYHGYCRCFQRGVKWFTRPVHPAATTRTQGPEEIVLRLLHRLGEG